MSQSEVIKNFTRGRKFPQLIGRTPDGKKILGGPYTLPQVAGGGVAALILWVTRGLWLGGLVWNVGFFLAVVLGTVFAMGKLRLGGRSPASVLQGVARAVVVPRTAKIDGHPIRPRRAHLVRAGGRMHPVPSGVACRDSLVEKPPPRSVPVPDGPELAAVDAAPTVRGCAPSPRIAAAAVETAGDGAAREAGVSVKELLAVASSVV